MAPRRSPGQKASMSAAREASPVNKVNYEKLYDECQEELKTALLENSSLEFRLLQSNGLYENLKVSLAKAQDQSKKLSLDLKAENKRYKELYQSLRTERRARQRANKRKEVLTNQILVLRSASADLSSYKKDLEKTYSKTMESLMKLEKENTKVKHTLSEHLNLYKSEMAEAHTKLLQSQKKLQASKAMVSKLQKASERAKMHCENAVKRATDKVLKEKSVHNLLYKGVYTEETRKLIRLLVKAGCSREYVTVIISAVLRAAGITTIGKISRQTVSRVILEGYYASCIQLGYELQNTKS